MTNTYKDAIVPMIVDFEDKFPGIEVIKDSTGHWMLSEPLSKPNNHYHHNFGGGRLRTFYFWTNKELYMFLAGVMFTGKKAGDK